MDRQYAGSGPQSGRTIHDTYLILYVQEVIVHFNIPSIKKKYETSWTYTSIMVSGSQTVSTTVAFIVSMLNLVKDQACMSC